VTVAIRAHPLSPSDFRLVHKTSDRAFWAAARDEAAFETVFVDTDGFVTEGSFTQVFAGAARPAGNAAIVARAAARRATGPPAGRRRAREGDLEVEDLEAGVLDRQQPALADPGAARGLLGGDRKPEQAVGDGDQRLGAGADSADDFRVVRVEPAGERAERGRISLVGVAIEAAARHLAAAQLNAQLGVEMAGEFGARVVGVGDVPQNQAVHRRSSTMSPPQ
jgi:hypothetical protein